MQELMEKIAFVRSLSKILGQYIDNVSSLDYKVFKNKKEGYIDEYLVINFKGNGFLARNSSCNSKIAILREIARLCAGGYYEEVIDYKKHFNEEVWEEIIPKENSHAIDAFNYTFAFDQNWLSEILKKKEKNNG